MQLQERQKYLKEVAHLREQMELEYRKKIDHYQHEMHQTELQLAKRKAVSRIEKMKMHHHHHDLNTRRR